MSQKHQIQALPIFNLICVMGVAACSFIISYHSQYTLALQAGFPPFLARLIPLIIDFTIIGISGNAVQKRIEGKATTWSIILVIVASSISLLFNIYLSPSEFSEGMTTADPFFPRIAGETWVIILVHAVGPLFLIFMTETLAGAAQNLNDAIFRDNPPAPPATNGGLKRDADPLQPARRKRKFTKEQRQSEVARLMEEHDNVREILPIIRKNHHVSKRTIQRDFNELLEKANDDRSHDQESDPNTPSPEIA